MGWTVKALSLAAAYAVAGQLSLLLAVPPGYATAVWPPAGIALTGLLVMGRSFWPGIWLGSFIVNGIIALGGGENGLGIEAIAVAAAIGLGAAAQAVTATWLVQGRTREIPRLIDEGEIVRFLFGAGPLCCLIGSTWGVSVLWASGAVSAANAPVNWATWWTGDTIGVCIFSILGLIAFGEPRSFWGERWKTVALPLAGAFLVVCTVFIVTRSLEDRNRRTAFESAARLHSELFERYLGRAQSAVRNVANLFDVSNDVDRPEFRRFVRHAISDQPGILALEWVQRVPDERREAIENSVDDPHTHPFSITESARDGTFIKAQSRPEYYPVLYLEPIDGNESVIGFDLGSNSARLAAIQRATDSGAPTATKRIDLVNDNENHSGMLLLIPVYENEANEPLHPESILAETVTERSESELLDLRRRRLRGFALGVFRLGDLVSDALRITGRSHPDIWILDITNPDAPEQLHGPADGRRVTSAAAMEDDLRFTAELDVGQRQWRLISQPSEGAIANRTSWRSWFVMAGGLGFASVLGAGLLLITGRTLLVEATVTERTSELNAANSVLRAEVETRKRAELERKQSEDAVRESLKEKETLLKEIHHRVKNNLQVICSMLQLQGSYVKDDASRSMFQSCQNRVRAMAMVHERLYCSDNLATIDFGGHLNDLASTIFHSHRNGSSSRIKLDVAADSIALDIDKAVPLGLIANELIVNALKHAFPDEGTGSVKIGLTARNGHAVFSVKDNGKGLPPDFDMEHLKSLGLIMVRGLARQIRAKFEILRESGTTFSVTFSMASGGSAERIQSKPSLSGRACQASESPSPAEIVV